MKSASRKPQPKRKYFKSRGFSRLFCFSWEQRKLGDVVQITMGQSPDGSTYSDEPSDYILVQGNADLQNGWVCPRIWTTQITKKADAGDLIMSVRAPAGAMGKTAYNAVIGRGVAAIKGNEFIYQLLVKMDTDCFWKTLSCGSTFESLNSDNIKNAEVKIPTTAEQIKIGGLFQYLDNLITLHQRDSIMRFFGAWDNANAWEQRKLGDVVKEVTRNEPCSDAPVMMITANNGFIEQSERYAFNNAGESLKKYILLQKGELAYNHGASKLRPYGSCFALTTAENARIPFVYHCFSAEGINPEFLSIELNGDEIEAQLRRIVSSGARMDGLLNISFDEYTSVSVLLPKKEEQDHIADFFRQLDHLITLHQRERKNRLFGGKNVKQYNFSRLVLQLLRAMDSRLQRRGSSQGDYG